MRIDKRKLFILTSPLLAIVIMCIFYAFLGIFPFGTKTVAWCDLNQQTIPLLMDLKDVLDGKSSVLYNSGLGGGVNFWGVFLFFLASPFYLAVKFIPKQEMSYFATVLLIIKISVCAFTASLYFSLAYKKLGKKYIVLLGLIYAFCGYGLIYYQTLVWLDIMYIFPLLILSVDRLCQKNKCMFFIITLSAAVVINYYLSYMIAIYLIISVPLYIRIRCPEKNKKSASCRFILSSFAAALITTPVWLCSIFQVQKSARGINNLAIFIFSSPFESLKDKLCIIITSAFAVSSLLFIIKSPLLGKKRVKYNLTILIFLMIPVLADPINKIWHGGGYQGFPLRFGYMIVFTLLAITGDILENIPRSDKTSLIYGLISFIIPALFSFTAFYVASDRKNILSYYINHLAISSDFFKTLFGIFIFAFAIYMLLFHLLGKKLISDNIFFLLISVVFITETFVNMYVYIGNAAKTDNLFDNTMTLENSIDEKDFYRVKTERKYIHVNMLSALGMKSYAHYTSLNPEAYMFAMKKLGYSSYWMETGSNGGTVMTDALLGIKYSIGGVYDLNSYQKKLNVDSEFSIAENLICVPAGIISDKSPLESEELNLTERFDVQRQIAERFFDTDSMLEKYDYTSITDGTYEYSDNLHKVSSLKNAENQCRMIYDLKITGKKILYLDLFDKLGNNVSEPIYNSIGVAVNGISITESYPNKNNNGLLDLGEFENENAEITITFLKDISVGSFGVFGIDTDSLENEIKRLKTIEPVLNGNEISAEFSAEKNSYLYLAVPWDSGFNVYINGNKTELFKVNDCFCAVKLDEGENSLKMVFYPEGFKISIVIMISGLISAAFISFKGKMIFQNNKAGFASIILCRFIFLSAVVFIYIVPVIVYIVGLFFRLEA